MVGYSVIFSKKACNASKKLVTKWSDSTLADVIIFGEWIGGFILREDLEELFQSLIGNALNLIALAGVFIQNFWRLLPQIQAIWSFEFISSHLSFMT